MLYIRRLQICPARFQLGEADEMTNVAVVMKNGR
jgi:hypothetical protein